MAEKPLEGCVGIGHTRWATHGEPNDVNAHPHTDAAGGIAVVHNGIVENHDELRQWLGRKGVRFVSRTDTEVIAHLLHHLYEGSMKEALLKAMSMLKGSYALGVLCDREPDALYCARSDSPLVIGFRDGQGWIASDIPALLSHTRDVVFLKDQEIVSLSSCMLRLIAFSGPFLGGYYIASSFLQSMGCASQATLVSTLRQGIFLIPMIYIMNALLGMMGNAAAHLAADGLAATVAVLLCLCQYRSQFCSIGKGTGDE